MLIVFKYDRKAFSDHSMQNDSHTSYHSIPTSSSDSSLALLSKPFFPCGIGGGRREKGNQ